MLVVNQEADELVMRVCFSVQHTQYDLKFKPEGKEYSIYRHLTKTKIRKKLEKINKKELVDYWLIPKVNVRDFKTATFLMDRHIKRIYWLTKADVVNFWLGDTKRSNFRYAKAKTKGSKGMGYKAGRTDKPHYFYELRDYLMQQYGAREIHGYEADDALGIYQKDNTIASHLDKDINMIGGRHFNWWTGEHYEVDDRGYIELNEKRKIKGVGFMFFLAQLLLGDSTDNIPNLARGYGDVKVYNILKDHDCIYTAFDTVLEEFESVLGADDGLKRLYEQADLLWICQDLEKKGSDVVRELLRSDYARA